MSQVLYGSGNMIEVYTPPLHRADIISYGELPDGRVVSLSALLEDANGRLFSLHVAVDSLRNQQEEEQEAAEPEFIVPGAEIDVDTFDKILTIDPTLLSKYLVEQEIA